MGRERAVRTRLGSRWDVRVCGALGAVLGSRERLDGSLRGVAGEKAAGE